MRRGALGVACWIVAAACHRAETPRSPEPAAAPAVSVRSARPTESTTRPTRPPDEADWQAALARDVRDASAYEGLAQLYFERSLSQRTHVILARQVIAQGLAVLAREGRTSADLLTTRGLLAMMEGRVDRGIEDLAAAVAIDPGHLRAQVALGAAALRLRDFSRAEAAYRAVVEAPGGDADAIAWLALGAAEQGQGRVDAAERTFRRAVELAPADPRPHYALARLATVKAAITGTERDEDATYASFRRARDLAGEDPRFAELRALAEEGMKGRRFLVCHYPVGTFYGTEEEYQAWLHLLRSAPRATDRAERMRLLQLEAEAAAAGR